jgi:hypothetical protein
LAAVRLEVHEQIRPGCGLAQAAQKACLEMARLA